MGVAGSDVHRHLLRYYLASTSVDPKPNFANILVGLTDSKYTKEYEENLDTYMKANYPNAITRTTLFKLSPAVDATIEIGFIGNNTDTLVRLTNQALEIMLRDDDLINVRNSWETRFLYGSRCIARNSRNRWECHAKACHKAFKSERAE